MPTTRAKCVSSLLLLLVLLAWPGRAPAADALTIGVLGAGAADLVTTHWAFASIPGARDLNPAVHGTGSAAAVKLVTTAGVLVLDRELVRRGHRRGAKVLKIATIVAWGSAAAWNARQIQRGR